jgi:hypothetical protein
MTDTISRSAVLAILRSPKASDTFPDMISRVEALEGAGDRVKQLDKITRAEKQRRNALSYHEQQRDAEASCAPCKLCGGSAVIKDAGPGWGYYIECANAFDSMARGRGSCLQSGVRLSGWAYNCSDMWNKLNAPVAALEPMEPRDD